MSFMDDKRAWRTHMAAVHALPREYEIVYLEIQKYFFKVGPVSAADQQSLLGDLLQLFRDGAKRGEDVLTVTGPDVAQFADGLINESSQDTFAKHYLS